MNSGIIYGILAYLAWGFLPLYWKLFESMTAWEILAHRIIWSFVFVLCLLLFSGKYKQLLKSVAGAKAKIAVLFCSIFISANWFIFIWAVNAGHVVETSLGYYINPLLNVILGVVFLKERPQLLQWAAIGLAAIGVIILTVHYGKVPWVSLSLSISFGMYGLAKKKAGLEPMLGLAWETIIVIPVAFVYLIFLHTHHQPTIQTLSMTKTVILLLSGTATALPLLWFAQAAKRLPLSTVGFIQYLAPTISLFIGVIIYNETFSTVHLVSFSFIWSALIVYSLASVRKSFVKEKHLDVAQSYPK